MSELISQANTEATQATEQSVAQQYFLQQLEADVSDEQRVAYERRLYMVSRAQQRLRQMSDPTHEHRLWNEQVQPYQNTLRFLGSRLPEDEYDDLTAGGYLQLPTGFGKSILQYQLLDDLGVGTVPGAGASPIRGLCLVPTVNILKKVAGRQRGSMGLSDFLPHMSTSQYGDYNKDLSGDVIVMTYSSFSTSEVRKKLDEIGIDVIVCDEVHNLHASVTRKAIEEFREGKITVGYSATTEYTNRQPLTDILPNEIISYDTRSAIEAGVVSGVQILGFWSGCRLDITRSFIDGGNRADYTAQELQPLAADKERNELILDLAAFAIEAGRRVVVSAIPGRANAHAHLLARLAERRMIVDPVVGKKRPIVAGVAEPRQRYGVPGLEDWHNGTLDMLTYTSYINQGWDSESVGAMIMARPTRSRVFGTQGRGRGLRKDPRHPLTMYFELFDDISGGQFTMWHVVGEDVFANTIITSQAEPIEPRTANAELARMSARAKKAHASMRQGKIRETIIQALEGGRPRAPKDWVSVVNLAQVYGTGTENLCKFLEEQGFKTEIYRIALGAPAYHVGPDAVKFLAEGGLPDIASDGMLSRSQMAQKFGVAYTWIEKAVAANNITGEIRRAERSGRVGQHYTLGEQGVLRAWIRAHSPKDEALKGGSKLASEVARELGISVTSILFHLRDERVEYAQTAAKGKQVVLDENQAARIMEHFSAVDRPEGYVGLHEIASATGKTLRHVREALSDLGLADSTSRFREQRQKDGATSNRLQYGQYLPTEQAELVQAKLEQHNQIAQVAVGNYAKTRGIKSETILRAVKRLSLDAHEEKKGKVTKRYLPPHTEYALDMEFKIPQPEWHVSERAAQIARCLRIELPTILRLMGLDRHLVEGEAVFVANAAVEALFHWSVPAVDNWGGILDIQTGCIVKYNKVLPLDAIHNYIWNGDRSITKYVRIARDEKGELKLLYRSDFLATMVREVAFALRTTS